MSVARGSINMGIFVHKYTEGEKKTEEEEVF